MSGTELRLLRLVQNQVAVGRPLPFGVRDEHGQLLLARGHVVDSDAQLAALLQRGAYVDIEEVRALRQSGGAAAADAPAPTLFDHWEHLVWDLDRMLKSREQPGWPERVRQLARSLQALVRRNPDVGIYLAMRQDAKRLAIYGLTHSLYCAMACTLAGERLGWAAEDTLRLTCAALTMNLSIIELQGRLATYGNKPTEAQLAQLRAHPDAAAEALAAAGVDDADWLAAVRQHHERRDGAGYPSGTREIAPLALALRQVDVLLAKVSPRTGRAPLSIQQAEREMFAECGGDAFASALIKEFGLFPPGDFVLLKSGEMAVVVRRGANAKTPEVAAITDRKGLPVTSSLRRDTAKPEFAIVGPAPDKQLVLRVPPERLFGLVA